MRLSVHLLRNDVRRFLPLLAGWWIVLAAGTVLDGVRPGLSANPAMRDSLSMLGSLLWLANVLIGVVVVALIVQADPLVGTDAFWMTRPISPRALLASKAILLSFTMIVAPVAIEAALMLVYKVPLPEIAGIAASGALSWMLWAIAFMAVAALTPNPAKFALSIGAILVGMACVIGVFLM